MSNLYVTPAEIHSYLGIATTDTDDDVMLEVLAERVSRFIDSPKLTNTWFYELSQTRYFDWQDGYEIRLDAPLLSATTVTNDGDTISSDDYRLIPRNATPKLRLEIIRGSGEHLTYGGDTWQDASNIVGLWGYHNDADNRWQDSGDTVQNATEITAAATSLSVTDNTAFQVGQTLKIELEQMYVSAIATNTLTIDRAENGTTAAAHDNGTAISIYRPMAEIREAAREITAQIYKMKDSLPWGRIEMIDVGTIGMIADVPKLARMMLTPYRWITV